MSRGNGEGSGKREEPIDAYRVWGVKAKREERLRLQRFYLRVSSAVRQACEVLKERHGDVFRREPERFGKELIEEASKTARLPKGLFWYAEEWRGMVAEARRQSKKRSSFIPPPVPLLVKVVGNGEVLHGATNALAVLDTSRNELRVPSAGIATRLRLSLIKAVLEDIQRFGDVGLTLQNG